MEKLNGIKAGIRPCGLTVLLALRHEYKHGMMGCMDKKELEEVLERFSRGTNEKLDFLEEHTEKTDFKLEMIVDSITNVKENLSRLSEKVDMVFEQTGKLTVDMEMLKASVQQHEQKIQHL